jgi:ketosteroid isomerase-like protein
VRRISDQNVEVVRRFYESWSKQDLAGVLDCAHAEFQFDWSASQAPFGGVRARRFQAVLD